MKCRIKRICSVCQKIYGSYLTEVSDPVLQKLSQRDGFLTSHGYCEGCYKQVMKQLEERKNYV